MGLRARIRITVAEHLSGHNQRALLLLANDLEVEERMDGLFLRAGVLDKRLEGGLVGIPFRGEALFSRQKRCELAHRRLLKVQ